MLTFRLGPGREDVVLTAAVEHALTAALDAERPGAGVALIRGPAGRRTRDGSATGSQGGVVVGAAEEAVVRRFYEEMNNGRKLELAEDLFTPDHVFHDPQVPAGPGPQGVADVVRIYQESAEGHWEIEEVFSTGDRVTVRWTGSGRHVGELNGVPATGRPIRVDAISVHRMAGDRIAETWEVWDTLGLLRQIGVVPAG